MSRVSFILLAIFLIIYTSNAFMKDNNASQQIVEQPSEVIQTKQYDRDALFDKAWKQFEAFVMPKVRNGDVIFYLYGIVLFVDAMLGLMSYQKKNGPTRSN